MADPIYYWRGLPYDPVRPWKEDGQWYVLMSTDGCNATKQKPCPAGGRLDLNRPIGGGARGIAIDIMI